ncbi:MAG: N-acyl homoserine lactone hydrolase [Thermoleophilaceae bacterium]|nr:N-acyl homoserine lactone hydrolase [Thermoleophilaceae bacterium]
MTTAAEPRPAQLPLPGGSPGATVKLHPLLSGTGLVPPAWLEREEGRLAGLHAIGIGVSKEERVVAPVISFMVEHPSAGVILIDTGLHPSVAIDPKKNLGRAASLLLPGVRMKPEDAVSAQLRARGIDHGDVKLVIMTHLHFDHASAISEFPEATFVVTSSEWHAATQPRGWQHGYRSQQFDHAFDYRLLDFDAREVDSYETFGRSIDLLGDGSVRAVYTPGHTDGHMSVILRLSGGEALVAGDAIYTRGSLERGAMPFRAEDEHVFRRSLKEIQLYNETRDALIIPGHDMAFWKTLKPEYA